MMYDIIDSNAHFRKFSHYFAHTSLRDNETYAGLMNQKLIYTKKVQQSLGILSEDVSNLERVMLQLDETIEREKKKNDGKV